ncbi:MurR/RpiR family transcriptional regulator [Texcoconibacillus texcoconensis]|uniref:DNA-binding MurR/RpiR family transcriptional regulator n=1 Tax=Texcoconibacillus texcoconensis TaxID=1095777 RepID=A0A840QLR6_9BACI|nr:MurR/RpiR family transcriptional regulator [Texcoconibacillus texcoconensis]MBB5172315.1 DNA-binding MurR/RpiR family transcriptional regulator [Texcoconibacillus texcoconensis]
MVTNEQMESFSDLDYTLYQYVTSHAEKVIYMRIRDLANETHVSPTTILRFCRKVDCDGFSEFKTKLKMHITQEQPLSLTSPEHAFREFIDQTLQIDYERQIKQIASVIAQTEHVIFLGNGSSGILAEYGSRYFSSLKKFSLHIKDPYFPIFGQYMKSSVSIILSVSGESEQTIEQSRRLREEGSTLISITNSKSCRLAKMSDYNLAYYSNMEFVEKANITSQLPVVYLLERLAKETYSSMHTE